MKLSIDSSLTDASPSDGLQVSSKTLDVLSDAFHLLNDERNVLSRQTDTEIALPSCDELENDGMRQAVIDVFSQGIGFHFVESLEKYDRCLLSSNTWMQRLLLFFFCSEKRMHSCGH